MSAHEPVGGRLLTKPFMFFAVLAMIGFAILGLMLATEHAVAFALVPPAAHALFGTAWWVCALAQPVNAVSFVTDGIHWGTRDYRYLRNAMLIASGLGAGALLALESADASSLLAIWVVTAAWISVRAALGVARVWPGLGAAPLRPAER